MAAESPKIARPRIRGSICVPASKRRMLLNAIGTRNSPAVSPIVRTGWRALGSRVNPNDEASSARGRIPAMSCGFKLIVVLSERCVSIPMSWPSSDPLPWRIRRAIVVESP